MENQIKNSAQYPSLKGFASVLLSGALGMPYKKNSVNCFLSSLRSVVGHYNFSLYEVLRMNPSDFATFVRMIVDDQNKNTIFNATTFYNYMLSLRKFDFYLRLFHGGQIPTITNSSFPRTTFRAANRATVPIANTKSVQVETSTTDDLSQIYISFITYRLRRVGLPTAIKDCTAMLSFCKGADLDLLGISKTALEQIEQSLLFACSTYASEKSGRCREAASTSVFAFLDYFRFLNGHLELRIDERSTLRTKYNLVTRKR